MAEGMQNQGVRDEDSNSRTRTRTREWMCLTENLMKLVVNVPRAMMTRQKVEMYWLMPFSSCVIMVALIAGANFFFSVRFQNMKHTKHSMVMAPEIECVNSRMRKEV
jgi:hypothetical protein